MRTIGVVTTSRADYGIYRPVLQKIRSDRSLALKLFVSGTHLSPAFGMTVSEIEADGYTVNERVKMPISSDSPLAVAKAMAMGTAGFARAFARSRLDILVVLGDRFEMHSAVVAALPFRIPVAHIHGGESTFGAIDESLRHSITKLSHLHFASTEVYARRIIQMGEEPWRVKVSGAPALDAVKSTKLLSASGMKSRFGLDFGRPLLLVTFHPATIEHDLAGKQAGELLAALEAIAMPVVFTMPNADTGGRVIRRMIEKWVATHPDAQKVENLGQKGYFSAMALSAAMVGNSSSGIIEAASFRLPVVNIGSRQDGRVRGLNVVDTGTGRGEILAGLKRALEPGFRKSQKALKNPYGDGRAAERIVRVLGNVRLDDRLIRKRFYDMPRLKQPTNLKE
ncbi:MAG: UDP-N-acetylglucosamine 2-epimerase [Myxococcota bacterium]|jgi:UDP-hydrolysing UDP-N-acetyl-D-glucosamine 2-epimerase